MVGPMRFSLWPSPDRPFRETVALVQQVERAGWHAAYVADHFMNDAPVGAVADGRTYESTAMVTALAASTSTIKLGTLVASATYRHPAVMANWAASVSQLSEGRLVLGLGAGWQLNEHHRYGIDLGDVKTRIDRFDEYVQVVSGLLGNDVTTLRGDYYVIDQAPRVCDVGAPRTSLLLGVKGERRTMAIAARHADVWNSWCTVDELVRRNAVLDQHCSVAGRDPAAIERSTQAMVQVTDDAAVARAARESMGGRPSVIGSANEVVDVLARYASAGCDEFIVPTWLFGGPSEIPEALERFEEEVVGVLSRM